MKLLFLLILIPGITRAQKQEVTFVDTVITSGYFYAFMTIPPYKFAMRQGDYMADFRFVPDSLIAGDKLVNRLRFALENEQIDKEKFLSKAPSSAFKPFEAADSTTQSMLSRLIRISPFTSGKQGHGLGVNNAYAVATHASVKWLKLRITATRAMFTFDNPPTLDVGHIQKNGFTYVYLPLEVLAMDKEREWWKVGGQK